MQLRCVDSVSTHMTIHWNELWGGGGGGGIPLLLYFLFCKVRRTNTNDLLYSEIPSLRQRTRILFNVTLQLNIKSMSH